jgi:hypothetical protein
MTPEDVEYFVESLKASGLVFLKNGHAVDLAVVDQFEGATTPCDRLEFAGPPSGEPTKRLFSCRLAGSACTKCSFPFGWEPSDLTFVPTDEIPERLELVEREDAMDTYFDHSTGQLTYVGRVRRFPNVIGETLMNRENQDMSSDDLITPENVSTALLKSIFEAAYMDIDYISDHDLLVVKELGLRCFVLPDQRTECISLVVQFSIKQNIPDAEKFRVVNEIHSNYVMVRAMFVDDSLRFDYHINLQGGVLKKTLVMTVKRFLSIPHSVIDDYAKHLIA